MELKQALEAYGVSYEGIMERFGGNAELYGRLLSMVFKDANFTQLGEALEAGDLTSAFRHAHTIKGVVANMGLTPLLHSINEIVEPLRTQQTDVDYMALYQTIKDELARAASLLCE